MVLLLFVWIIKFWFSSGCHAEPLMRKWRYIGSVGWEPWYNLQLWYPSEEGRKPTSSEGGLHRIFPHDTNKSKDCCFEKLTPRQDFQAPSLGEWLAGGTKALTTSALLVAWDKKEKKRSRTLQTKATPTSWHEQYVYSRWGVEPRHKTSVLRQGILSGFGSVMPIPQEEDFVRWRGCFASRLPEFPVFRDKTSPIGCIR